MSKILLFGRNKEEIPSLLQKYNFEVVEENPDFVISYGGDGTLLQAEYLFPGLPKIFLKNSMVAKLASVYPNEEVLKKINAGEYKIKEFIKLEARAKNKTLCAINDIVLHNGDPRHAIRYKLFVDGKEMEREIIGDGIVVATPYGGTGYYRSITDSSFEAGIGLAFNNSTEQSDHIVLREESEIRAVIARGPAVVYADNQDEEIGLDIGDEVVIRRSFHTAKIVFVN